MNLTCHWDGSELEINQFLGQLVDFRDIASLQAQQTRFHMVYVAN